MQFKPNFINHIYIDCVDLNHHWNIIGINYYELYIYNEAHYDIHNVAIHFAPFWKSENHI